jgi:pilus assembly protein Flp/PilA
MSAGIRAFLSDDNGATAIEYSLIAALIAVGIIASLKSMSTQMSTVFTEVSAAAK